MQVDSGVEEILSEIRSSGTPSREANTTIPLTPHRSTSDPTMEDVMSPVFISAPATRPGRALAHISLQDTALPVQNVHAERKRVHVFFEQELAAFESTMNVRRGISQNTEDDNLSVAPKFMLHPGDKRRIYWDIFCMWLLFYSVVHVPIQVAFDDPYAPCSARFLEQFWSFYVDFLVDIVFLFDLVINLRTAYWHPTKKRTLVLDQISILFNYAKGFLFIDLLGAIPIDILMLPLCAETASGAQISANNLLRAPKILKQLRLLRALRLLRVSRLKRMFDGVRDQLNISPGYLRLVQLSFVILMVLHYDACIMYWIGVSFTEDPDDAHEPKWDTWVSFNANFVSEATGSKNTPVDMLPRNQAYLVAFYWAWTTVMTVGFGDVTPVTTYEAAFTIFVIIQGGCALGYVVGSFADMLSRVNMRRKRYRDLCEQWDSIFHQGSFPSLLRKRIREFNHYKYTSPTSSLPEFAQEKLSKGLLREITACVYKESLTSLPFFRQLVYADHACATELALMLRHKQMPPLELIYSEGVGGSEMYFLSKGVIQLSMMLVLDVDRDFRKRINGYVLEARKSKPGKQLMHFVRGEDRIECPMFNWILSETTCSHFGESVLFSTHGTRLSTAVTQTDVTLLTLSWDSIQEIAHKYSAARNLVQTMRRSREPTLARLVRSLIQVSRSKKNNGARLKILIHGAESLPKMDTTARCDPFVELTVDDSMHPVLKARAKNTIVCRNTYDPTWNHAFTYSLKDPHCARSVSIAFSVLDWDIMSPPDLAGTCTFDVSTMLKECMEQQREILLGKQWIPLMMEKKSLFGRLRGSGQAEWAPVKGFNGKVSRLCCSISCAPPEHHYDQHSLLEEQSRCVREVSHFRRYSSVGMPDKLVTLLQAMKSPLTKGMKRRSWAESFKGSPTSPLPVDRSMPEADGRNQSGSPSISDVEDILAMEDPSATVTHMLQTMEARASNELETLHSITACGNMDPSRLRISAVEAWSNVKTLSRLVREDAVISAQDMEELRARVKKLEALVSGTHSKATPQ